MRRLALGFVVMLVLAGAATVQGAPEGEELMLLPAMDKLAGLIAGTLDSSQTLGAPLKVGDLTIVPVLVKALGFGVGEGLFGQEEASERPERGRSEQTKDRHGIGGGGGGFMRPIALLVITKDGHVQVHRLQESALAQLAKALMPAFQKMIQQRLAIFKMKMGAEPKAPPPPGKR